MNYTIEKVTNPFLAGQKYISCTSFKRHYHKKKQDTELSLLSFQLTFSRQVFWLVNAGKAQVWPAMLTIHFIKCPCKTCQWVSMHSTRTLGLAQLNGMQPSLMLFTPPVLWNRVYCSCWLAWHGLLWHLNKSEPLSLINFISITCTFLLWQCTMYAVLYHVRSQLQTFRLSLKK